MLVKLKLFKLSFNNLGKVVHMLLCSYSGRYQHGPAQDFFLAKWHFLQICESDLLIYTVSENDTDVVHYNFNAHQPILVIFGRDVAKTECCQMVICYPNSPN